jgi:hypothetical protein
MGARVSGGSMVMWPMLKGLSSIRAGAASIRQISENGDQGTGDSIQGEMGDVNSESRFKRNQPCFKSDKVRENGLL